MMSRENIGISTIAFDLDGAKVLRLRGDSLISIRDGARRVTRTATLDGGVLVHDTGYAVGDRTLKIQVDAEHVDWLEYLVRTYRLVHISLGSEFYTAVPARYWMDVNNANIQLDLIAQLA